MRWEQHLDDGYVDGVGDAYRHTFWQALTVVELVESAGLSVDQAVRATRELGDAHEQDSLVAQRKAPRSIEEHGPDQ